MSITLRSHGSENTLWNFFEDSYDGPNWAAQAVSESSATQLVSRFLFEGGEVVFRLSGSFPEGAQSVGNLSAVAAMGASVSGYDLSYLGMQMESASLSSSVSLSSLLAAFPGTDHAAMSRYFAGNDVFIGSEQGNGEGEEDGVNGYAGNDTFQGNAHSTGDSSNMDKFFGGDGIDTAVFRGTAEQYQVRWSDDVWMPNGLSGGGYHVVDMVSGRDGTKALRTVERLKFSDKSVALDIDAGGNALETLQFIGVIAPDLQGDLNVRGTILSLFDQGKSMLEMSQLALNLGLITSDNTALAKTVFKNVFNTTADPDQNMTDALVGFIEQNGDAQFLATVAGMNINVDLVGLQQSGMEYIL